MNPLTVQKIKNNFEIARKSISTYVVAAVTAGGAWWFGMTGTEQIAWLTAHPAVAPLVPWAPWISGVLWIVTKLWPQFFPRPVEVKDDRALQLDAWLKKLQDLGFVLPTTTPAVAPAPAPDIPIDPTLAALKAAGIDMPTLTVALAALRASRT